MYQPEEPNPPVRNKPYIEGVTVCVNYSDFLAFTLPFNRTVFDKLVVVTDRKDYKTKRLCDYYAIECIQTDAFYEDGASFNKAKGINEGLKRLSKRDWVIHFDSDIAFPPLARMILNTRELDKTCLYGVDRLMCHGFDNWIRFIENPVLMHELYYLVQPKPFPLGTRVAHYNQHHGWMAIGFHQMWNPKGSNIDTYPEEWVGADHTDVVFARKFPAGKNVLIPEYFVYHIDSERGQAMGKNWMGRKTELFTLEQYTTKLIEKSLITK